MYASLDLFQTSSALARHAGAQQALVATNVANADTPGYRARTLSDFADAYRQQGPQGQVRMTRPNHQGASQPGITGRVTELPAEPSPNGNSVSIEEEMLHAIEAQREHSRALAVYRHAMGIVRTTLGR
jgi:flagellar basal-body rod protein FlgB